LVGFKPKVVEDKPDKPQIGVGELKWDRTKCGTGISFENNMSLVFLKEQAYVFRSVTTTFGFTSGVHYWEIVADSRTENELKIGVSTSNNFDFNTAFCDHSFGWAFYGIFLLNLGLGQLRHHSNASGPQYGKRFKKEGTLGVYLNMNKGTLALSLNGESMGVAFTDAGLTKGPIYPTVSLLHCAGCLIKGELPIPPMFQNM
jgi:E3 ubiquitin-protein ligase NRDP1